MYFCNNLDFFLIGKKYTCNKRTSLSLKDYRKYFVSCIGLGAGLSNYGYFNDRKNLRAKKI